MRFAVMMIRLLSLFLLLPLAGEAVADLVITRRACDWLVEHQPAPGVDFQAGVDAHGRPVAPADLDGGSNIIVPEVIAIPLEVLIQDRYQIPANSVLWEAKAQVGTVVVENGQIYYEGQLLGEADQAALARACQDQRLAK